MKNIAIIQPIITDYRSEFFNNISQNTKLDLYIYNNINLERVKGFSIDNDMSTRKLKSFTIGPFFIYNIIPFLNKKYEYLIQKGFNQKRSGDVVIVLNSGWIEWNSPTGTTHGSCFSYDTHVPLLFWGKGIKHGLIDEYISICDIAPTVSTLLGISFPNGCTGNPIRSITE